MKKLEEFYKRLSKFKDEYEGIRENKSKHKYKLFNIKAMNELINNNSFLKTQYDKLKNSGKNIFGYHYNEIILSFLFIKYVKNKGDIYDRYLNLRHKVIKQMKMQDMKDKEYEKYDTEENEEVVDTEESKEKSKEELDEMDTFSAGNYQYSQPAAFAKDKKNWRHFQSPINNAEVVSLKGSKHRINEMELKDIDKKELKRNISIEKIDGFNTVKDFVENFDIKDSYEMEVLLNFEQDIDNTDNNVVKIKFELSDLVDYVKADEDVKIPQDIRNEDEHVMWYITNVIDELQFDDILHDFIYNKLLSDSMNENMEEHHINSPEKKIMFILSKSDAFTEDELKSMNSEEIDFIYKEIENEIMLKEEKQHDAITRLNRIHKETEAISNKYYKDHINKGVQKSIKNPDEGGTFEYEYDKDSIPNKDIKKFDHSKNDEYVDANRGATPADVDWSVDNKPSKEFLDRLKEQMGDRMFKLMIQKAKLRKLEKENQRNARVMIQDPEKQAKKLDLDLSKINENFNLLGKYDNEFKGEKLISFKSKETKKLNESDKTEGYKELILEGLDNYKTQYQKDSVKYLDFYLDEATGGIFYKPKEKKKIQISESYKNSMNTYMNHKGSFINEVSNKRAIQRKKLNEDNNWFSLYSLPTDVKTKVNILTESIYDHYYYNDYDKSESVKDDLMKISSKLYGKDRISYSEFENIVKDKYKEVFN